MAHVVDVSVSKQHDFGTGLRHKTNVEIQFGVLRFVLTFSESEMLEFMRILATGGEIPAVVYSCNPVLFNQQKTLKKLFGNENGQLEIGLKSLCVREVQS